MEKSSCCSHKIPIYLIYLFLVFNQIIKISTLSCSIAVPDSVTSQQLNNIICIGPSGSANVNFAEFSDGSLIIESSKDSGTIQRYFYGITKQGTPYFPNNQYHMSLFASSGKYRKESENFIITINDDKHTEYLMSIGYDTNIEIYDLNNKQIKSYISTKTFIGSSSSLDSMDSLRQTGINYFDGTNHYLFYGYLTLDFNFYFKKLKFSSTDLTKVTTSAKKNVKLIRGKAASCYMTEQKNIGCITISKVMVGIFLYAYIYDINLNEQLNTALDWHSMVPKGIGFPYFIKCIHLKNEIGVYSFYANSGLSMVNNPILLFKEYSNKKLNDFIPKITLDKKEFNNEILYNDLIKVNDNKLCFISTSENKEEMYIVSIYIHNDKTVVIRYYLFNIFSKYTFKFYTSITAHSFNNYIAMAFSFCRTESCGTTNDVHYPGFMIFNYPNGTDFNRNLIDLMFTTNKKFEKYGINLHEQIRIENNIFGLKYCKIIIKNINDCNSIDFYSSKPERNSITEGYQLSEAEEIHVKINTISKRECSIGYIYYITEPDYEEYNTYPNEKVFPQAYNSLKFEEEKDIYESRLLYYNLTISEDLSETCDNENCELCKDSEKTHCIVCRFNFIINKDENGNKYKICLDEGNNMTIPIFIEETGPPQNNEDNDNDEDDNDLPPDIDNSNVVDDNNIENENITMEDSDNNDTEKEENNKDRECDYLEILNNECQDGKISNDQMVEIYKQLKQFLSFGNYNGQSTEITTENVVYQISTFPYQKDNDEPGVSSIDLGQCEADLKNSYNISDNDSLIILKLDSKNEDNTQTYVHFELFDPYDYTLLNLNVCNSSITINTPIDLDDNTITLYESLMNSGYNLFDSNDPFYNDICTLYTTTNGTDMIISDRKNLYTSNGNVTMCQTGCEFVLYNTTTKKSKCDCQIETFNVEENDDLSNIKFSSKKLGKKFGETFSNSNFRVMKCYKLAIDLKNIFKNIGRIIMTAIFLFYLFSLFCFIINENNKIDLFIGSIMKGKDKNIFNNYSTKNNIYVKSYNENQNKTEQKGKKIKSKNKQTKKNKKKLNPPKKRSENRKIKKQDLINIESKTLDANTLNSMNKQKYNKNININIFPVCKPINDVNNNLNFTKNKSGEKDPVKLDLDLDEKYCQNLFNPENYNDQELNTLDYNIAVYIDKRTYLQYYWSLLKKKHLILFTFLPANDYNLYTLKIGLFFLSFSLYLTINAFFFSDSTMHKITEDNGKYNIIYQIPQIICSSVISAIINIILKALSLSEKALLKMKKEKNLEVLKIEMFKIRGCILCKFVVFFIMSILFLAFFWYFIACFCAVYTNTQNILFKDTLISFGLSMLYPFGLNLLPGIFRIPALRDKSQNSQCLYKFSGYVALI